jgi:hypothetical protein
VLGVVETEEDGPGWLAFDVARAMLTLMGDILIGTWLLKDSSSL